MSAGEFALTAARVQRDAAPEKQVKIRDLRKLVLCEDLDPVKCVRTISTAAAQLAQSDAGHGAKLKRLSELRNIVHLLEPHLTDKIAGALLPAGGKNAALCDECDRMYSNLSRVAKGVFIGSTDHKITSRKQTLHAVSAGCWAIEFLAERLKCAYGGYTRVPLGVWPDVHWFYRSAAERHIERHQLDARNSRVDIELLYKKVVTFGLSDPYQLSFRSMHQVFDSLGEWASMVRLTRKPSRRDCLFELGARAEYPAMPVLGSAKASQEDVIYLDTRKLVSFLKASLVEMRKSTQTLTIISRKIGEELEYEETLKNLIIKLGIQPFRRSERAREERVCRAAIGLQSVVSVIGQPVRQSLQGGRDTRVRSMELMDETEFGARLRMRGGGGQEIPIGELVAIDDGHDEWLVGLVRWAQVDGEKRFQAGIYKFLDNVIPVVVKPLSSLDETPFAAPSSPAIWCVRKHRDKNLPSLVIATATYKPRQTVLVCKGKNEHALEMRSAVLSTRHFVWCDVSLAGSSPELTLELLHPGIR